MTSLNAAADSTQAEGTDESPPASPAALHGGSKVYMSGPLFLSSKGIGWTSWKKRWFILTQTSLVFYRSDPNAAPQKGGEVNATLGGIDLNSSGSVVAKEDKKLITVSFADGRDGRAFTLKAETLEDLCKWKTALEEALANAPSASPVTGQNGAVKNEPSNSDDVPSEQSKDKEPTKSLVLGRPILLALEDTDGTPSFLEKALRFVEEHGVKTEGILRQAADVELVERRIQEYEKGKVDFSPNEDAHVIGDCIKYILRELPSSPVPASCCKALVEAHKAERNKRVYVMQSAICETFPEPNRRLLQRILEMCIIVASNKAVNRMSISAVAACMAPLLLRPLLAGECEIDANVDVGDSAAQLLQAAAAANHAQAIVITLLDEFDNIFGDGAGSDEPYTDSEDEMDSEELSDDESFEDDEDDDYVTEGSEYDEEESIGENHSDEQVSERGNSGRNSPQAYDGPEANKKSSSSPDAGKGPSQGTQRRQLLGRAPGKKNLSRESCEIPFDDDLAETQNGIPNEALVKSLLQDLVEKRKHGLHERCQYLKKDAVRLQEQLHKEMDLKAALDAGLKNSELPPPPFPSSLVNEKMKAELEDIARAEAEAINLKKKVDDLELRLYKQREQNSRVWKVKHADGAVDSSTSKDKESPNMQLMAQTDATQNPKLLSVVTMAATAMDPAAKLGPTASKKAVMYTVPNANSNANSSLLKLTNRLNFLKERRTQIANELQSLNVGRTLNRSGESRKISTSVETPESPESSNKHQEFKAATVKRIGTRKHGTAPES